MAIWAVILLILLQVATLKFLFVYENNKTNKFFIWGLFFVLLPGFAFVLYICFDWLKKYYQQKKYINKCADEKIYDSLTDEKFIRFLNTSPNTSKNSIFLYNYLLYKSVLTMSNKVDVLNTPNEYLEYLIKRIETAKKTICIQVETFACDLIGDKIRELLIRRCKEGIQVKLLYGNTDTLFVRKSFFRPLILSGAKVANYAPLSKKNKRNIAIFDSTYVIIGSSTIVDRELNCSDTNLVLEGEIVPVIEINFLKEFGYAFNKFFSLETSTQTKENTAIPVQFNALGNNILPSIEINESYNKLIKDANESIIIQTNKFLPDSTLLNLFKICLKSNIKVQIMISRPSGIKISRFASMYFAKYLHKLGAEINVYEGKIYGNILVIDDKTLVLGTSQIDKRDVNKNYNCNVVIEGKEFAQQFIKKVKFDSKNCNPLKDNIYTFFEKLFRFVV